MGYVFFAVTGFILAIVFLTDRIGMSTVTMIPPIYYCILGALCWGIAVAVRNKEFTLEDRFKDWLFGFIFIGILIGVILGAYMW